MAITICRKIFVMFDPARLLLFMTAALLLAVAPGPGMLYVLARSLAGGKREGALSALGTFLPRRSEYPSSSLDQRWRSRP